MQRRIVSSAECQFALFQVSLDLKRRSGCSTSEDANVEYLLDVFTSADANSVDVWDACGYFMEHLYWYKKRLVMLGPKIEGLPDDHPSKPECLFRLSRLFDSIGIHVEYRRLLVYTLKLQRELGNDFVVAERLRFVSDVNRVLDFDGEVIEQAREALEIYKRLNHVGGQAKAWQQLASSLYGNKQLGAAKEAVSHAIDLLSDDGD